MDSIQRLTSSLKANPSLQCLHCLKQAHFISHGFVYKQLSITHQEAVGKRIICCNRYGHQGCGRTYQLNISSTLSNRRYNAAVLFAFICLLLRGHSVSNAYQQATKQTQSRHAWRWLKQLKLELLRYRGCLTVPKAQLPSGFKHHFKHNNLLFLTLAQLFSSGVNCPCATFQIQQQQAFI